MNSPSHIVFLDRGTLPVVMRAPALPLQWRDHESTLPEQVVERLAHAEVAISNKVPLMAVSLAQLPKLKLIAVAATGTNNVDLDYCREHGIAVSNVSGYSTDSVAEHVFALLLALRRQVHSYHADILAGEWQRSAHFALLSHPLHDLHGSTLGIFGYGHIGQAVARIAAAFGMKLLVAEHKNAPAIRAGRVPFEQMLEEADAVTLHCPLTPQTRNLIGEPELRRMKPAAILLNLARGGVVDEAALAQALREKRIAGAGVDVLVNEPPRAGNPLLEAAGPNCIVTPHVAWASRQSLARLAEEIAFNIEAFYKGEARNRIV
ncbi:MAG: glycerate dehydrogenase [Gallionellales bacterium RIFCSPLOWO2_12_FULL_59_22]|nr:MAG: glycerate dehydrogenase [Gallionellales bacterium RIFCSPLOWO2_02_FULL_59_110]OGT13608.1 MAG: glycerate dehydrogenase [Gallionellales bacterium RIFCSPLOWO2_12_FULL_59_22]